MGGTVGKLATVGCFLLFSSLFRTTGNLISFCCSNTTQMPLLVDTLGLPISVYVTPAGMHDTLGARRLLVARKYVLPRLKKIWADAAYRGKELAEWCKAEGDWDLEVVERTPGVRGFAVLPKRWIVECTFGWISRNRRMSKDYERKVQTSETLIELAMIRLLIARLGQQS
jgi:putative transposase